MAKIAVELKRVLAQAPGDSWGHTRARVLARGDGWTVEDVICTRGPRDRPFEEQHTPAAIALVTAGSFQYRSAAGRAVMTPGSLMLGNPGQRFECEHDHGVGDRCLAFRYAPAYFERIAADAGVRGATPGFGVLRLPPLRSLSPLVARACAALAGSVEVAWEELGVQLAVQAVQLTRGLASHRSDAPSAAIARVTRTIRLIEQNPDAGLTLGALSREAGLSPYHFLRTFERLTGVTPHQFVLRARLRQAALRLCAEPTKVLDIALDCGFGDVSNFNRTFRAEFHVSPRLYRRQMARRDGERSTSLARTPGS